MRSLRGGPDCRFLGLEIHDSTRWAERCVALERPPISSGQLFPDLRHCGCRVAAIHKSLVALDSTRANKRIQLVTARQRRRFSPRRLQSFCCTDCSPFVSCDDTEKVLNANDARVGNASNRSFVHGNELCSERWWTNHAAMQHARHGEVLQEYARAGAFLRHIRPKDGF